MKKEVKIEIGSNKQVLSATTSNLTDMSETVDQIYQDNKDIEDVMASIQESKKIAKLAPPMIAFRATGTMTTQAADPGKSHHVIKVA